MDDTKGVQSRTYAMSVRHSSLCIAAVPKLLAKFEGEPSPTMSQSFVHFDLHSWQSLLKESWSEQDERAKLKLSIFTRSKQKLATSKNSIYANEFLDVTSSQDLALVFRKSIVIYVMFSRAIPITLSVMVSVNGYTVTSIGLA